MERAVSAFERALYASDAVSANNIVTIGRVEGPLADATLRRALKRLQRRHPLLNVHIETDKDGGNPRFVSEGTARIGFRTLDQVRRGQVEAGWHSQAEFELNSPFESDSGLAAPARIVALRSPEVGNGKSDGQGEGTDIMVTLSSHIGDAASGVFLLQDLLRIAASDERNTGAMAERSPLDQMLPKGGRTSSGALGGWFKKPKKLELDAHVEYGDRRTRFIAKQLKPSETKALIERCRAEKTTVNGALCAAVASALAADLEERGTKKANVALSATTNLREHIDPPLGDEVGPYAANAYLSLRTGKSETFWKMARDAQDQVGTNLARGEVFVDVRSKAEVAPQLLGADSKFIEQSQKRASTNVGVYNLGRLPIDDKIGPFTIRKLQFVTALPFTEYLRASVATHRDWLAFNLQFVEDAVHAGRAEHLAEQCVESLLVAAGVRT